MKLRAPAYPLITIDPFFSVWSPADRLTDVETTHWTVKNNTISGTVSIDGSEYRFMGATPTDIPALEQVSVDVDALSTKYIFRGAGIELSARFTSPLIPDDYDLLTRPVSYLALDARSIDGADHDISAKIALSEELCLDFAGQSPVEISSEVLCQKCGLTTIKMGNVEQKPLADEGDDHRIDWGYVHLNVCNPDAFGDFERDGMKFIYMEKKLCGRVLFSFAYDDLGRSIEYFGDTLSSWWNRNGATIGSVICAAQVGYDEIIARCDAFSDKMFADAVKAGGEKYAEILMLSYRQAMAAHKLVLDRDGEILWISKECHSNGCAATVDVSYPSIPLFLLYNPELVRGMMRPIYRYAADERWTYDFAPHDAGRYPLLNGQKYGLVDGNPTPLFEKQMPVEECGNMLIMEAATAVASGDSSFAEKHFDVLEKWVVYLIKNGNDPENQLCTDDFAGHLAHNCNLSLKAIMGIESMAILCRMCGREGAEKYEQIAREMAKSWAERAANGDGSYRLAFDAPGSFSMKYNIVWDKLFGTGVMPVEVINSEVLSYRTKMMPYGLALDNRQPYTKSDWTIWTATLAPDRETFEDIVAPLWTAYNFTASRVPMTDWYWVDTGLHKSYKSRNYVSSRPAPVEKSFRNRTVVGGHFIKLLEYSGKMRVR